MPTNHRRDDHITEGTAGTQGVELKVTISERKERAAARAFGLDPKEGERRRIFFFDTADLALFNRGLVLRAREVKNGKDDSTVKIRPVDRQKITDTWRRLNGFKIEADGVGSKLIRSASLSVDQRDDEIKAVESGVRAIEKLFSSEQELLLAEMSPVHVNFWALQVLGTCPRPALDRQARRTALCHHRRGMDTGSRGACARVATGQAAGGGRRRQRWFLAQSARA